MENKIKRKRNEWVTFLHSSFPSKVPFLACRVYRDLRTRGYGEDVLDFTHAETNEQWDLLMGGEKILEIRVKTDEWKETILPKVERIIQLKKELKDASKDWDGY